MEQATEKEINERLASAINTVVKQQIEDRDPPETLITYERLQEEGFTAQEANILIGKAVGREVAEMLVMGTQINLDRYIMALNELPHPFAAPKVEPPED